MPLIIGPPAYYNAFGPCEFAVHNDLADHGYAGRRCSTSTVARTSRCTAAFYLWFLIIGWSNCLKIKDTIVYFAATLFWNSIKWFLAEDIKF